MAGGKMSARQTNDKPNVPCFYRNVSDEYE